MEEDGWTYSSASRPLSSRNLGVSADEVVLDASFREDLQADSLDLVELIMAFEEEFGSEISDEDAQRITTVRQAVDYISERMN